MPKEENHKQCTLQLGDMVRFQTTGYIGKVTRLLKNPFVEISIRNLRIRVQQEALDKVQPVSSSTPSSRPSKIGYVFNRYSKNFDPSIDLHGLTVVKALQKLGYHIDSAICYQKYEIKIIHGKGDGILCRAVTRYLNKHTQVSRVEQKLHLIEGWGVTWAYL